MVYIHFLVALDNYLIGWALLEETMKYLLCQIQKML